MKKSFGTKRVPRKVGQAESDALAEEAGVTAEETSLKRPVVKPRKSANLRTSFKPSAASDDDGDGETPASIVRPKRSNVSRLAIQRNASQRLYDLPPRPFSDADDDRPSYSAESLQALKESTPATPQDFGDSDAAVQDVAQSTQALDLTSKFGSSLARYQQPSAIPSTAEIEEKKARRARLAKEQQAEEYISLDPDDPGLDDEDLDDNVERDMNGRLVLKEKDKYNRAESRLVRDDEDIMENFDDFTEDGKMQLGRKAEKEAEKRRREEMAAQIAAAEGDGSDAEDKSDSDTSEKERNAAFEAAQTRHGTYGTANVVSTDPYEHLRPKTPPVITPLPTLDGVIARLRKQVAEMQSRRLRRLQEMEALQREKVRLGEEEVRIQKALRETAEKFRLLRAEKGIKQVGAVGVEAPAGLLEAPVLGGEGQADEDEEQDGQADDAERNNDVDVDEELPDGPGLTRADDGWVGMGPTAGLGSGMAQRPAEEDDW
ncbi:hypothetical protein BAUCODRAFT_72865 [Baudoinia panamericana UAMH 10762]|uniref:Uncharacterized protein n=1 Tax=Baudoinia panamericana (strain UAMH 10762) TaxID=717646 RepID=M2N9I8_BAUPA|nr:uncharacterized protein BAUCODRAFT_72865 [Baudoinia panamericana UAMH 10762]EMC95475.1 hypothetical protein BAUCODRAFT_72865 [Baudoinia panamericana UAMH 10762]